MKDKSAEINRLLAVMHRLNVTPELIAEATGVAERTINNVVWSDLPIGGQLLRRLVEVYGVSADWLLTGRSAMLIDDVESVSPGFLVPFFDTIDSKDAGDRWLVLARAVESALIHAGAKAGVDYDRVELFRLVAPMVFKHVEAGDCAFFARENG